MIAFNPSDLPVAAFHRLLLGAVTPRPIALVSTIDREGNVNLSPFSFFNCFGANPPILVFSASRRVRDNTTKHTYENVREVPEAVVHIVNYNLVQQTSLASTEYPRGVNEFVKAGFTQVQSEKVRPPRAGECPIAMECKVNQIVETGQVGGAGILIICEVLLMHVSRDVMANDKIDPFKLDAVSRLGGDYYARINSGSIFTVPRPLDRYGVGMDQLPENIKRSSVLTGNDLAILANVERIPERQTLSPGLSQRLAVIGWNNDGKHRLAQALIAEGNIDDAWQILLA